STVFGDAMRKAAEVGRARELDGLSGATRRRHAKLDRGTTRVRRGVPHDEEQIEARDPQRSARKRERKHFRCKTQRELLVRLGWGRMEEPVPLIRQIAREADELQEPFTLAVRTYLERRQDQILQRLPELGCGCLLQQ